ncbi:acetoin dehydrogenase dihydrolipoyllysine-residue acetyltransferase subunit [Rhizobium sp. SSA_523]|uniref:acetoin dehydrogenase dihydrolipoyllysine-residue acetyltransferase subunit n=1 Tax=Rhizobium sp. SSA_523 TaxID=2952477 RepID=UPI002090E51F|nr:acetoin dehydrogenase dihydrolipoyllysine-residue acetyltransferase subunit [Rhizobium sp. SSA_523]MCO5733458.1 acetoin dehydrogenase dihydrolipoyllysine-residue acetyltransferase subunit [Rhizobium sp. SSA_523]WKC21573.1 acetoin dehydrogenase dihydrolipoyllysine-residue acetyltransferase subunit [Rhizobium sp. SSA_523]
MPVEVILPKVDMDMTHGTLAIWHVKPGDLVQKGAALFDIETDKAAMEVEAPSTGRLQHVLAQAGAKVPVGSVIAWLYAEDETVGAVPPAPPETDRRDEPHPGTGDELGQSPPEPVKERPVDAQAGAIPQTAVRATPAARHAARNAGIDLATLAGSGPRARIQKQDVEDRILRDRTMESACAATGWVPDAGDLAVTRRPGRGEPLVVIHGFAADSTGWLPFEKALATDRSLIRIDLPGHGKSPKRKIRNFAHLARMVLDAFDEAVRGVDRVHVLGHSLGGAVAASIADIRAPRILSLTAIAPAGLGPDINGDALLGIARASRAESLLPWLQQLTGHGDQVTEDYAKAAMRSRADPGLRACQLDMADVLFPDGAQAFDLRPAFGRLPMPAAIIWGRQDKIAPFRHALNADADLALHFLHGIGHIPHFECPERVARIVERHLAAAKASG